jgi:hypothetical protein
VDIAEAIPIPLFVSEYLLGYISYLLGLISISLIIIIAKIEYIFKENKGVFY